MNTVASRVILYIAILISGTLITIAGGLLEAIFHRDTGLTFGGAIIIALSIYFIIKDKCAPNVPVNDELVSDQP